MNDETRRLPHVLTGRDVAEMLGVSPSMISRAFNPGASVAPAMRMRIIEAVTALGYRPNVIARSLATRSSNIVAIIVSTIENPFYAQVLERLSKELQIVGFQSLLFSLPPGQDVDSQLPFLVQYNVDAVVIVSASISAGIAKDWTSSGRKVVLFNRTLPNAVLPSVCCDNFNGAQLAADHFVAIGRKRIAYASGRPDTSTNAERELGFITRLAQIGMPLLGKADSPHCTFEDGYQAVKKLVSSRPDAIFFANDVMAIGGMEAIRQELGLRVPEDIAVIGFDDIPMAAWPTHSLTTIRQPLDLMVSSTVRLISEPSGAEEALEAAKIVHPGHLVCRGSARAQITSQVGG